MALAVFSSSCSSKLDIEEPGRQIPMSIGVSLGDDAGTKAPVSGTAVPSSRTLVVSAYENLVAGGGSNYFAGATFTYGTGSSWRSANTYWPLDGSSLDFLCYSLENSAHVSGVAWGSNHSASVSMTLADNSSNQDDLLVGGSAGNTNGSSAVTMRHAEALLLFKAFAHRDYSATDNIGVTVTDVKVVSANHSGTVACTRSGNNVSFAWSALGSAKTVSLPSLSATHIGTTPVALSGTPGLILPAQAPKSVTVYYTLHKGKDGGGNAVNSAETFTFTPTDNWDAGKRYIYTIEFVDSNNIQFSVVIEPWTTNSIGAVAPVSTPLTITALGPGTNTIIPSIVGEFPDKTFKYSKNGGPWTTTSFGSGTGIAVSPGDRVSFIGDNDAYADASGSCRFLSANSTSLLAVSGNIMSMAGYRTSLSEYHFAHMFEESAAIVDASELELPVTTLARSCYHSLFKSATALKYAPELPATTLANYCYADMFHYCSNLLTGPSALPATEMKLSCYGSMFNECENLLHAPALPATTLAPHCYSYMFQGCSSLDAAPALPATELEPYCYTCMFFKCSNLVSAPALPATVMKKSCYSSMFKMCYSLETPPALPATTLAESCYYNMFDECLILKTAPALPATTLADDCYNGMFYRCEKLQSSPVLPALTPAVGCYTYMFYGCKNLTRIEVHLTSADFSYNPDTGTTVDWCEGVAKKGVFRINDASSVWESGGSYRTGTNTIPEGWTVERVTL